MGLNAAYLPKEIGKLRWDMVDWDKKFLRNDRKKSERLTKATQPVPRCCVLGDRTIEALDKIKTNSEYMFISRKGKPVQINTIIKRFRKLVENAKIESKKIAG